MRHRTACDGLSGISMRAQTVGKSTVPFCGPINVMGALAHFALDAGGARE